MRCFCLKGDSTGYLKCLIPTVAFIMLKVNWSINYSELFFYSIKLLPEEIRDCCLRLCPGQGKDLYL